MSLITGSLTLSGGTDSLATVGLANGAALGNKAIYQLFMTAPAAQIQYGPAPGGTFTTTPDVIAAATTKIFGPFSGGGPLRTTEFFVKGTASQVVIFTLISR